MAEQEHVQFIVPDIGSMAIADMAFIEAIRKTSPAKAVELAIVAYHWSEQMKSPVEIGTEEKLLGSLMAYPSLEELRNFLDQYVKWRDKQ